MTALGGKRGLASAKPQCLYKQTKCWRRLSSAWIIKVVSVERGTPAFQHPHGLASIEQRLCTVFHDISDTVARSDGLKDRRGTVEGNLTLDADIHLFAALLELPHVQ